MRPRSLVLALVFAGAFWFITSHGQWNIQQIIRPLSNSGKLWYDPVTAHGSGFEPDEQNNIDVYKNNRAATVNVKSTVMERDFFYVYPKTGLGSGFIINESGEIVTNFHVISGASDGRPAPDITVTLSGGTDHKEYKATVLGFRRKDDLALLKINTDHKLPFVHLGDSENLQVGQKVLAIGNPFGFDGTLTTGIVSSLGRNLPNENGTMMEGLIQTDAAINPGNSGGPLLDSHGDVIGINTMILGSQTANGEAGSIGIGVAMPINRAKSMLQEYQTTGQISRPVLGITDTYPVSGDLAEALELPASGGLLIQNVEDGSPAARAGIRGPDRAVRVGIFGQIRIGIGGDLITAIDGKQVETRDALTRAVEGKKAGDKIELKLYRDGRSRTVTVTLGSAPEVL
ncbi:MAG: trypsin-like peptidase domain-containing protein [Acidobacteriota bacterium]|nr:trypsin-like peptidase domain-containing protein [Acidobacteriota bacterium]